MVQVLYGQTPDLYLSGQTVLFLQSCLLGAVLGVTYDLFRILRVAFKTPVWVVLLQDLLYFFIAALFTFGFLMSATLGSIRIFMLFGEFLGAVIYYCTIGSLVFKAANQIVRGIKYFLGLIARYLFLPIARVCAWIGRYILKLFIGLGRWGKKNHNKFKMHLKSQRVLLYNLGSSMKERRKSGKVHDGKNQKEAKG